MSSTSSAPSAADHAARQGLAWFDRGARPLLRVDGKSPAAMLKGVVTGRIPGPAHTGAGATWSEAAYSTLLTPKGRIVSDLVLIRLPGEAEAFWMDVPATGEEPLRAHLAKVLPPRLARVTPVTDVVRRAVVGPDAARVLAAHVGVESERLTELPETRACFADGGLVLFRPPDLGGDGFELVGAADVMAPVEEALRAAGAVAADGAVWETLRIEARRPLFGVDMGPDTIPIEAGLGARAIDHAKGCYTGQEVIVRIRDRGHVNRHLRLLLLGDADVPEAGTPLHTFDGERAVGEITSAVRSPGFGQTIALGYVRREVEPGQAVRVGTPSGPEAVLAPDVT